jgi:hypothetical protein
MGAVSTCAPHKELRNGSGNSFLRRYAPLRSLNGRSGAESQAQRPLHPACGLDVRELPEMFLDMRLQGIFFIKRRSPDLLQCIA